MRIGLNALLLSSTAGYRQSGIHRYLAHLIDMLPDALGDDQAVIFTSDPTGPLSPNLRWSVAPRIAERPGVRVAWEQLALPARVRNEGVDLFHGAANALPVRLSCPAVVTIHDLAFLRWPGQVTPKRRRYLSWAVRDAARRATRVLAVSESGRAEIVERLGVPRERVGVTPLGVDPSFKPMTEMKRREFRQEVGQGRPYILAVGTLEPRKNLPALLRAFRELAAEIPHDVVLIGAEGWLTSEIHRTIADPRIRDRVRLTGFVPPARLPAWYGACDLFVMPSLHEGFGLPLLEAMASGAPAVASHAGSLPEVAGDAALLTEPSSEALAESMRRVLGDEQLQADLRRRGPIRAKRFTWSETARRTVAAYRRALAEG